jgi:hypothetical protein
LTQALALNSPIRSGHAVQVDFDEATRRLQQTRKSRHAGMEPLPGEQATRDDANTRYLRYKKRQLSLEGDVILAIRRLAETSQARSAFETFDSRIEALSLAQP